MTTKNKRWKCEATMVLDPQQRYVHSVLLLLLHLLHRQFHLQLGFTLLIMLMLAAKMMKLPFSNWNSEPSFSKGLRSCSLARWVSPTPPQNFEKHVLKHYHWSRCWLPCMWSDYVPVWMHWGRHCECSYSWIVYFLLLSRCFGDPFVFWVLSTPVLLCYGLRIVRFFFPVPVT